MRFTPITVIFIFLLILIPCAFIKGQGVDTVCIYKNKSDIGYSGYWYLWFWPKQLLLKGGSFSSRHSLGSKFTHQDSIVMVPPHSMYYKVYDRNNRLILEGQTNQTEVELIGDIKYFYKSGKLKRLEKWGEGITWDSCDHELIQTHDAPGPEGTWIYYRENGSICKTVEYLILPCKHKNKISCYWVSLTNNYSQNGKKGKTRIKELGGI